MRAQCLVEIILTVGWQKNEGDVLSYIGCCEARDLGEMEGRRGGGMEKEEGRYLGF